MDLTPRQDDHEAKMARADLFKLAQYSFKLFKMIHEDQELEGWVQAKITKAADYIASVYHYMEYEMKFSEYGEKLENSDVYHQMPESQRIAIESMLTEAKETMKKLTAAQAKKLKKKEEKVKESAKPDFADLDDDGDEEEPMKKAAKDAKKEKKVKEGFPTVDDAKKRHEQEKGTGKFDKKEVGDGRTQYTRKSSTFTDGGDDSDVKAAKKKDKKVKEDDNGRLSFTRTPDGKTSVSSSTGRIRATIDKDKTTYSPGKPEDGQTTQPPAPKDKPVKETSKKKAAKDYDGDGKVESPKDEVWGSRAKAAAKSGKPFKEAMNKKCNHTPKGKSCPVHGLKECGSSMAMEAKPSAGMSKGAKSALVKKAKSGGDIGKPGKSFDKVAAKAGGGEKGKKIAAAAMWKNAAKESVELTPVVVAESTEMARLKELNKILNG